MPDHIHLLIQIHTDENGNPQKSPTISMVIRHFKAFVSKQAGFPLWQKGFYDHIIRHNGEYQGIWEYIENNPMLWIEDRFYP